MAKSFAPRKSKKVRVNVLNSQLHQDLFKFSDDKLLKGARLEEVDLKKITIRDQVRTKFDNRSLKELAENIKLNGLIQPLVIHREGSNFVLLCGERRFRAMNLIEMKKAPCFILEGKTQEELMAIQFSENSSREELHYLDKADGIYNYKLATGASERKIQNALGISKSEVHRGLILSKLSSKIKEKAKVYNTEKYVLLEYLELTKADPAKKKIEKKILAGEVTKRAEFKKFLKEIKTKVSSEQINQVVNTIKKELPKKRAISKRINKDTEKIKNNTLSKKKKTIIEDQPLH